MLDNIFKEIKFHFNNNNSVELKNIFSNLIKGPFIENILIGNTFYHPLGFIYCKIYEIADTESLRIHIWDKSTWSQVPVMDIHNHFYTVNSFVFKGTIENHTYLTKEDMQPNYSIYQGSYKANGRVLQKTLSKIYAEQSKVETITHGNIYRIYTNELHSSYVKREELTCTFVYTQVQSEPRPHVLGPLDGNEEYYYNNDSVDELTIKSLLNRLSK